MAATQIGTSLILGSGTITGSYLVLSKTQGSKNVDSEDFFDGVDGSFSTRVVYNKQAQETLELLILGTGSVAQALIDFPMGGLAAHSDFSGWHVDNMAVVREKSPSRVSVSLTNLGTTLEA